jgi:uncharacterized membrane protein YeaQ/YmgE (transglycosylase-associated protein family)
MLTFLLWTLFGAFIGWLASLVMARDGEQGTIGNILLGIAGASVGGYLFQGELTTGYVSFGSVLTAFVGAVLLVAVANFVVRTQVR